MGHTDESKREARILYHRYWCLDQASSGAPHGITVDGSCIWMVKQINQVSFGLLTIQEASSITDFEPVLRKQHPAWYDELQLTMLKTSTTTAYYLTAPPPTPTPTPC